MKSIAIGWLLGLGLLLSHVGCCSIPLGGGCGGCRSDLCGTSCDSGCGGVLPFGGVRQRIANRIRSTNCSSGCGEIYWDEQINEPPVCDPCGCDGSFDGVGSGTCPTALGRLRNLWGYRYQPSNCNSCSPGTESSGTLGRGGCSSCGSGSSHMFHTTSEQLDEMPLQSLQMNASPTNTQPTPAVRQPSLTAPTPDPIPDPKALNRPYPSSEKLMIGSGTTKERSSNAVEAKQITRVKQSTQGRPRLVTK